MSNCTTRALTAVTGRVPLSAVPPCTPSCDQQGCPTTRRHPRTLNEAFNDVDRARSFYPDEGRGDGFLRCFMWVTGVVAVAGFAVGVALAAWSAA